VSAQIEKAVRDFHERVMEVEQLMGALNEVLSIQPEAPINHAIWSLIGGYRDALGAAYSIDGWLEWWWLECGLGSTPLHAAPAGGQTRTIATIDDFVRLVLDDVAANTPAQAQEE
jgi:hypothetical protein